MGQSNDAVVAVEEDAVLPTVEGIDWQRPLDAAIALAAILLFLPMMVLIALAISLQDGGPIFFGHARIGRNGQTFRCWKFRSMVVNAEQVLSNYLAANPEAKAEWDLNHKLKNDPRITKLGQFLRASSLDELPQLWNVVTGEMGVVGPRPIVAAEVKRYGSSFRAYCSCRPGITGLWQISGRSDVSYPERVAMDVRYAQTRSVWLNLAIMFRTVPAVLARKGSY